MRIRAITFDCAGTLVDVNWKPELVAVSAAHSLGISTPPDAPKTYQSLQLMHMPQFLAFNLEGGSGGRQFYNSLNAEWLKAIGADPSLAPAITTFGETEAFGPGSKVFKLYPEVHSTLTYLRTRGILLGVISNWDYTLRRVLEMLGLLEYLSTSVASLEEGVEKPDPKLFEITLARMGCLPSETLHVGDDLLDDIEGANNAGMPSALIRRDQLSSLPNRISSLSQIVEVLDWPA